MTDVARLAISVDSKGVRASRNDLSALTTQGKDTERRLRTATSQMESSFNRLRASVFSVQGAMIGLGGALALHSIVSTLAEFEQAMSTVKAVSQATGDQFAAMTDKAKELGATTRFSATQAAEGMLYLSRAGFSADETLASIGDTLNLAQAGALDLGAAADIASNIMQGFQMQASQAGEAVDVLAYAANNSNTNVAQLGDAMAYVAPVAQGLGVRLQDTAAAVGALSDAGLQGSMAGTGLRRVLSGLEAPTKKAAEILNSYGITTAQVSVSQHGLINVLETLSKAGISTGDALEIMGDRGGPAFEVLTQSIPKLRKLTEELNKSDGTAKRIAGTMDDNLNGALLATKSAAEAAVLALGDLGASNSLTQGFQGTASALRSLADNMDTVVDAATLLAATFGGRVVGALAATTAAYVKQQVALANQLKLDAQSTTSAARRAQGEEATAIAINNKAKAEFFAAQGTNAHATALTRYTETQIAANAATARAATAQTAATVATAAYTRASTAAGVAARGLSAAMALVGGPLGAAALAAGAVYMFRDELGLTDTKMKEAGRSLDELTGKVDLNSKAWLNNAIVKIQTDLDDTNKKIRASKKAMDDFNESLRSGAASSPWASFNEEAFGEGDKLKGLEAQATEAEDRIKTYRDRIGDLDAELRGDSSSAGGGGGQDGDSALAGLLNEYDQYTVKMKQLQSDRKTIVEAMANAETSNLSRYESAVASIDKQIEKLKTSRLETASGGNPKEQSQAERRIEQMRQELALSGDLSHAEETRIALANGFFGQVTQAQETQLMNLAEERDRKDQLASMREDELAATEQQIQAEAKRKETVNDLTDSLMTQSERTYAAFARRQQMINANVQDEQKAADLRSRNVDRLVEEMDSGTSSVSDFARRASENIQDQLGDTLQQTLSGNFDGILDSWGHMLIDMAAQAQAAQISQSLFGGSVGGGKGKGLLGILGTAVSTGVNAYFGGGVSSASASTSLADAGVGGIGTGVQSMFGGAFASGGNPPVGKMSLVGENGPEMIIPRSPTTVIPNHQIGGGNSSTVVNIINQSGQQLDSKKQEKRKGPGGEEIIDVYVRNTLNKMVGDGSFDELMQPYDFNRQQTVT